MKRLICALIIFLSGTFGHTGNKDNDRKINQLTQFFSTAEPAADISGDWQCTLYSARPEKNFKQDFNFSFVAKSSDDWDEIVKNKNMIFSDVGKIRRQNSILIEGQCTSIGLFSDYSLTAITVTANFRTYDNNNLIIELRDQTKYAYHDVSQVNQKYSVNAFLECKPYTKIISPEVTPQKASKATKKQKSCIIF